MCHSVVVQVRTGCKRFTANWTCVRPLAAMYAFMCVQRAGCGKRFVALGASVRTFSCEQTCGDKSFKFIDLFEQVIIMNYSQASNIILCILLRGAYCHSHRFFFKLHFV